MSDILKTRLREDLNSARRARDKVKTTVLSTTLADLRNREIELGREATDADVLDVVGHAIKKRREAADQIRAAGAEAAAAAEEHEAELLSIYMPPPLDEAAVREMVRAAIAAGAANIGAVMGAIMPALKGRFDGREANRIVREELG